MNALDVTVVNIKQASKKKFLTTSILQSILIHLKIGFSYEFM